MSNRYRPGEKAPKTGDYTTYDVTGHKNELVHVEKDDRFPPTQNDGGYYEMER